MNKDAGKRDLLQILLRVSEAYLFIFLILFTGFRYQLGREDIYGTLFITLAIMAAAWFYYAWRAKKKIHLPPRPEIYIALILTAITSALHSVMPATSLAEIIIYFVAVFLFLLVYNLVIYGYPKKHIINAALITGAAFLAVKTGQVITYLAARSNTCSKLVNLQNKTAAFSGLVMFLALAAYSDRKGKGRIFPGVIAGWSAVILLCSGSRGGLISVAVGMLVFIAGLYLTGQIRINGNGLKARFFIMIFAVVILLPLASIKILRPAECVNLTTGAIKDNSAWTTNITTRLDAWLLAVDIGNKYPVLGAGPGTYRLIAAPIFEGSGLAAHAHNLYLNALAERGLIGLFMTCAALLTLLATALAAAVTDVRPDPALAVAGLAVIVAYLIHGLVDAVGQAPYITRYLAVILALALTPREGDKNYAETNQSVSSRRT